MRALWTAAVRFLNGCGLPAVTPAAALAATASAIPATAATAAGAFRLGTRLVDIDGASAHLRTIQGCDRLLAVFVARHFHEPEAAGATRVAVSHNADAVYLSVRLKEMPQFVFVGVKAEIPHENILHASASALSCRECKLDSADLAGREGRS